MSKTRNLVRYLLRKKGFGTWKINSSELLNFENLLYIILQRVKVLTFLHIGAHDGKSFSDPLFHFVSTNPDQISGAMFEPVKAVYDKLVANLGHIDSIRLVNTAVHPHKKRVAIYKFVNLPEGIADEASGRSTVHEGRLDTKEFGANQDSLGIEEVKAIDISQCVKFVPEYQSRGLHILCIDTEGLDYELLRSIDFQVITPLLIRFEHNLYRHRTSDDYDNYFETVGFLNSKGYDVFTELNDAVAVARTMVPFIVSYEDE